MRSAILSILLIVYVDNVPALELNDSSFCVDVKENRCVRIIPNGSSVRLNELPEMASREDGKMHHVIYFYSSTRNHENVFVGFLFGRQGECYSDYDNKKLRGMVGLAAEDPTMFEKIKNWFRERSGADLWSFLGISSVDAKGISAKFAKLSESNNFITYDYRFIDCPGTVRAVVIDSNGETIPPPDRNAVKAIAITK